MSAKHEFPKPRLVTMGRDSQEFQAVQHEFERIITPNQGVISLDCIQRVENAALEALFEAQVSSS